jgi:hypothetical protein
LNSFTNTVVPANANIPITKNAAYDLYLRTSLNPFACPESIDLGVSADNFGASLEVSKNEIKCK